MAIFLVDLPIENGGSFHTYVTLPDGLTSKSWDTHMQNVSDFASLGLELDGFMGRSSTPFNSLLLCGDQNGLCES